MRARSVSRGSRKEKSISDDTERATSLVRSRMPSSTARAAMDCPRYAATDMVTTRMAPKRAVIWRRMDIVNTKGRPRSPRTAQNLTEKRASSPAGPSPSPLGKPAAGTTAHGALPSPSLLRLHLLLALLQLLALLLALLLFLLHLLLRDRSGGGGRGGRGRRRGREGPQPERLWRAHWRTRRP